MRRACAVVEGEVDEATGGVAGDGDDFSFGMGWHLFTDIAFVGCSREVWGLPTSGFLVLLDSPGVT